MSWLSSTHSARWHLWADTPHVVAWPALVQMQRTAAERGDARVVPGWRGPAIGEVEGKRNHVENPVERD